MVDDIQRMQGATAAPYAPGTRFTTARSAPTEAPRRVGAVKKSVSFFLHRAPVVCVLTAVAVSSLAGCATDQFKPMREPKQFVLQSIMPAESPCDDFELRKEFGGDGDRENRGSTWWTTRVWRNEQRCEVSSTGFLYRTSEEAGENYETFSPKDVYGPSWPWDPIEVDPPNEVAAQQARVICLGGDPEKGCLDWYYWAQYGNSLVELEFFNVDTLIDTDGIKVTREQFFKMIRRLDTKVVRARAEVR